MFLKRKTGSIKFNDHPDFKMDNRWNYEQNKVFNFGILLIAFSMLIMGFI